MGSSGTRYTGYGTHNCKEWGVDVGELQAVVPGQSIREIVYDKLKGAIMRGEFAHGERLVEHVIASQLQVSRTPVREALKRLESEGLLTATPRQGLVVKGYSANEIREIYMIREALESLAASCAAKNATEEDIRELEHLIREMDRCGEDPNATQEKKFEAHRHFSEAFNQASHMPTLVHLIESLREQMARFRRISLRGEKRMRKAREEHRLLVEAVRNRDPKRAAELVLIHIEGALEAYLSTSDANGGDGVSTKS